MKRLVVAVLAALSVTGCGMFEPPPESGRVVGRTFDDPDTEWNSICVVYDNDGFCSVSVPMEEEDPAHYYLELRSAEGKEGRKEVPSNEYALCWVEDSYPDCAKRKEVEEYG